MRCDFIKLVMIAVVTVSLSPNLHRTSFAAEDVATDKGAEPTRVLIANGALQLSAPKSWTIKQPRSRIVAYEFGIPASDGDPRDGRLTIMGAGGSIEANIDRWVGQFDQPSESKVSKKKVAGQTVSLVNITGTYNESVGGPFAGKSVKRPDYRMLAAIIQTEGSGNYFIKLYGPANTIAASETQFQGFVESLQATK